MAFSEISPDILDQFLQYFHHMKVLYVQMMDLYLIFQFVKGRCHGNQIILRKCYQWRLMPLAFVPLVLENELQYHDLAMHIKSGDVGATLSKNLVKFCLVNPMMMGLICLPMYLYWAKIDLAPAFVGLPFRSAMEYCYVDRRINSSSDQTTSGINLVGFQSVSPEFTRINCVQ